MLQALKFLGFVEQPGQVVILYDKPKKTVQELMEESSEADGSLSGAEWVRDLPALLHHTCVSENMNACGLHLAHKTARCWFCALGSVRCLTRQAPACASCNVPESQFLQAQCQ